jgi:putative endonuclease
LCLVGITGMFIVYVLHNRHLGKIYVGFTSDLDNRLIAHNHPDNKGWTKKYQPWEVVHTEQFELKSAALLWEKQLKSARGREFIKKSILK